MTKSEMLTKKECKILNDIFDTEGFDYALTDYIGQDRINNERFQFLIDRYNEARLNIARFLRSHKDIKKDNLPW